MKIFFFLIIFILTVNCSFDKKSGIWKNSSEIINKKSDTFKDFENITSNKKKIFNEIVKIKNDFKFNINTEITSDRWLEIYYNLNNNYPNFSFNGENKILHKSKKISRYELNKNILYLNNIVIISDIKGNIIFYSLESKKILNKYNFYKKQYKNIKKKLNLFLKNNYLYISDNIGYLYVFDLLENKIVWAKKFNIPFRSNIKIVEDKLYLADENNTLLIINSLNGNIIRRIPTEELLIKNEFINNISSNNKSIFYLNTFGSLYSIDKNNLRLNWFLNINQSEINNFESIFSSKEIQIVNDNLIILNNQNLQVLNVNNGSIKHLFPINSSVSPVVINDYIFIISKNNLLISIDSSTGKIIYSLDVDAEIAKFLKSRKKNKTYIKSLKLINSQIYMFLENSYLVKFDLTGNLIDIMKLPSKLNSRLLFINNNIMYINKSNKIILLN